MKIGFDYVGIATPFYCHDGAGRFLFHKRSANCRDEQGKWDNGGGALEFGLSAEENVLKEVAEEYGCVGTIDEMLPYYEIFREWEGKRTHWICLPFLIKIDPKEAKNNEPDKIDEIGWFYLDALPSPLHPGITLALGKYVNIFARYGR